MLTNLDDTIAAIATASGGAARGVVRIAGPRVLEYVEPTFHAADGASLREVRTATAIAGRIDLAGLGRSLEAELYFWPTARSYTRSPLAEIHTLGSPPLLAAVLRTVCEQGARPAAPGEFTLRAFLGGRIDLAQAEAVLGVIDAQGQRQLRVALDQLAGGLSAPLLALRQSLVDLLADLEAGLDFVDQDIALVATTEQTARLVAAQQQIEGLLIQMQGRGEAGSVPQAVLLGMPNVGKSSLFNALLAQGNTKRPAALVSDQAGTTRDYLVGTLRLGDTAVQLTDTAGLSAVRLVSCEAGAWGNAPDLSTTALDPTHAAETATLAQRERAAVHVLCLDTSRPLLPAERDALRSERAGPQLIVLTKCDLPRQVPFDDVRLDGPAIETSATSGVGIARLAQALADAVAHVEPAEGSVVAATANRCRANLTAAADSLQAAVQLVAVGHQEELVAAELRAALVELGQVAGTVYTDDILDRIFSRFCVGK
ncbi:MAG: 50S ribosome-binding GTPase [Planctomycetia bacterium]|nr:50S ribosome-binding GTPase [Planctomycetia bacterium]